MSGLQASLLRNNFEYAFPNCITGSLFVKKDHTIEKIFPSIGLPNHFESVKLDLTTDSLKQIQVLQLLLSRYVVFWGERNWTNQPSKEVYKLSQFAFIAKDILHRITERNGIVEHKETVYLTSNLVSFDRRVLIKAGANIIPLISKWLKFVEVYFPETFISGKKIKQDTKKVNIVFTSDKLEGAWDIATMSMRGVKSCMRWDHRQSRSLMGSIADPACGMIYITNNKTTPHGSKMLFRALVRLAFESDRTPVLILDRIYSSYYKSQLGDCSKIDLEVRQVMLNYLKSKVDSKVKIIDASTNLVDLSKYTLYAFSGIADLAQEELSYRDVPIVYDHSQSFSKHRTSVIQYFKPGSTPESKEPKRKPRAQKARSKKTLIGKSAVYFPMELDYNDEGL